MIVDDVTPTSPAAQAGLAVGDRVLAINGIGTMALSARNASDLLLRSKPCTIDVQRPPPHWLDVQKARPAASYVRPIELPLATTDPKKASSLATATTDAPLVTINVTKIDDRLGVRVIGGRSTAYGGIFVTVVSKRGPADVPGGLMVSFVVYFVSFGVFLGGAGRISFSFI